MTTTCPELSTTTLLPALRLGRFRGVLVLELSQCRDAVDRARALRQVRRPHVLGPAERVERHRDGLLAQRLGAF